MKNRRIGPDEVIEKFGVGAGQGDRRAGAVRRHASTTCPARPASASRPRPQLINEYGDLDTLLARAGEIKQDKRRETLIELRRPDPPVARAGARSTATRRCRRRSTTLEVARAGPGDAARLPGADGVPHARRAASAGKPADVAGRRRRRGARHRRRAGRGAPRPLTAAPIDVAAYECVRDAASAGRLDRPRPRAPALVALRHRDRRALDAMRADLVRRLARRRRRARPATSRSATREARRPTCSAGSMLAAGQIPLDRRSAMLKPLLEDPSVLKVAQNAKYDWPVFAALRHRRRARSTTRC